MSLFPDSNNSDCRSLFEDTKKSLYELAKNLEISSISNSFFTECCVGLVFNSPDADKYGMRVK